MLPSNPSIQDLTNSLNALLFIFRGVSTTGSGVPEMRTALANVSDLTDEVLNLVMDGAKLWLEEVGKNSDKSKSVKNAGSSNLLKLDWKLGVTTASSDAVEPTMNPFVALNFTVEESKVEKNICVDMNFDDYKHLHSELKAIKKKMVLA